MTRIGYLEGFFIINKYARFVCCCFAGPSFGKKTRSGLIQVDSLNPIYAEISRQGFGLLVDDCDMRGRESIRQNRRTGDTVFGGWASQIRILTMISCIQEKFHLPVVP